MFDDFVDPGDLTALRECLTVPRLLDAGVSMNYGPTGRTAEVPPAFAPILGALAARLDALIGLPAAVEPSFRVRHAAPGDAHPLHTDAYDLDDARLCATATIYVDAGVGGRTLFPAAEPPLHVEPRPGRVAIWFNYTADALPDPASAHALERVESGARLTLNYFVYARPGALRGASGLAGQFGATSAWDAPGRTLTCVDDTAAPDSAAALGRACRARGIGFRHVFARALDPRAPPLPAGSLLYCVSTTAAAERAERQLWQPGVATFHRRPEGPFVTGVDPLQHFARAGLSVPRAVPVHSNEPAHVAALVAFLGGLPVVVKTPGGEGGIGTLLADSLPALHALLDLLRAQGTTATLLAYVPDAMHLRVIVVGDRALTAYRNPLAENDFRSRPSGDASDYHLPVPPEVEALAVRATQVLGYAFAGVDVLLHGSGRIYLLEANFPCYFPQAERFGRVDVAGAMVEFLRAAAEAPT